MKLQNILKLNLMNQNKYFLTFTIFMLFLFQMNGQESWELVKDKNGIQVFTRANTISSFKEFKAIANIDGKVSQFLSVIYDIEGLTDWGYNIKESKLLDRSDLMNQTYYAVAKAPWPYKDRDGIYLNQISWNKESRILNVDIQMLQEEIHVNDDYVRMDGYGYWQIREVSNETLEVVFQMQVDPGGAIKAWMANMFVTDSPYQTLLGLKDVINEKKYLGKSYEFLNE